MEYIPDLSSLRNSIYKPLDRSRHQIRILILHPGGYNDALSGKLVVMSVLPPHQQLEGRKKLLKNLSWLPGSRKLRYEAVSYRWGDASNTEKLKLGVHLFDAPTSATEVLRYLRLENEPRNLWIDAICINQHDIHEREHQVTVMADIYRNATQTNIWLGKDDEETPKALQVVRYLVKQIPQELRDPEKLQHESYNAIIERLSNLPITTDFDVNIIRSIFRRAWFSRLWVYQEVVSSRLCICHIGWYLVPWLDIELVALLPISNPGPRHIETLPWLKPFPIPAMTFFNRVHMGPCYRLSRLVFQTLGLQSTDPRDKIYSLLSLTSWKYNGLQLPKGIEPNYGASVKDCFRNATRVMIQEDGALASLMHFLTFTTLHDETGEDWPTWTPHLDMTVSADKFMFLFTRCWADNDRTFVLHNSSEGEQYDADVLVLEGFVEGSVISSTQSISLTWNDEVIRSEVRNLFQTISLGFNEPEAYDESLKSLCEVVLGGRYAGNVSKYNEECNALPSFIHMLILWPPVEVRKNHEKFPYLFTTLLEYLDIERCSRDGRCSSESTGLDIEYLQKELLLCRGRRVFYTSESIGIGPSALQKGDRVAVLFGSPTPVVLRPTKSWYRLVGTCYVQGMMDGEVVQKRENEGSEPQVIELR